MVNNESFFFILIRVRLGRCWFQQLWCKVGAWSSAQRLFSEIQTPLQRVWQVWKFISYSRSVGFHLCSGRQGCRGAGLRSAPCSPGAEQEPHKRAREPFIIHQHVLFGALANKDACKQRHVVRVEHGGTIIWLCCRPCSRRQNLIQLDRWTVETALHFTPQLHTFDMGKIAILSTWQKWRAGLAAAIRASQALWRADWRWPSVHPSIRLAVPAVCMSDIFTRVSLLLQWFFVCLFCFL